MDTNKLKVVPDQALVYDIDEIDGAMYMFREPLNNSR